MIIILYYNSKAISLWNVAIIILASFSLEWENKKLVWGGKMLFILSFIFRRLNCFFLLIHLCKISFLYSCMIFCQMNWFRTRKVSHIWRMLAQLLKKWICTVIFEAPISTCKQTIINKWNQRILICIQYWSGITLD